MPKSIIIKREDVERVIAAQPANNSNARLYFSQIKMKNSTHIAASELLKEYGNVPVITRGDYNTGRYGYCSPAWCKCIRYRSNAN